MGMVSLRLFWLGSAKSELLVDRERHAAQLVVGDACVSQYSVLQVHSFQSSGSAYEFDDLFF